MKTDALQEKLGVRFHDATLLETALTHSSRTMEEGLPKTASNERLEFLGDAFFDAVIGEDLYRRLPDEEEGVLTKKRAQIVCEESLYEAAKELELEDVIEIGKSQKSGMGLRPSIMADAMEAIIGAVYLDQGFETCRDMVLGLFEERTKAVLAGKIITDYKSAYQERRFKEGVTDIRYRLDREEGPDHDKVFYVTLLKDGQEAGTGFGRTKKEAEQQAAKAALRKEDEETCISKE